MNYVVLLAGGIGSRMNSDIPKQHMVVNNHQIIEYTLAAFANVKEVDAILVVSNKAFISQLLELKKRFSKLQWIIPGGKTRISSVYNAIQFLDKICGWDDRVIISDAARPCIRVSETKSVINKLDEYKVVTTGVEVYETILRTDNKEIIDIIQREGVLRQTSPEGYWFEILQELYLKRDIQTIHMYPNIGLEEAKKLHIPIGIVKTSPLNFKITTPEDINVFETILRDGFEKFVLS